MQDISKKIQRINIVTNRKVNEVFSGNYKSSFKGSGIEVSDIREYEEGEDVRNIDWITTAKQGKPYVKKYQETRELTTIVVVDISASMNFTSCGVAKKDVALELCSILLFSALKNGDKFGALLFSDKVEKYIPPKKGKAHLLRIVREIIVQFQNNKYKKSEPKAALGFLNSVIKRHAVCFFVSDEINEDMKSVLKISNRKYDFVFSRIYDAFEDGAVSDGMFEIEDPETGKQMVIDLSNKKIREKYQALRAEKILKMKSILRSFNIDALELSTQSLVFKELLLFFKKRQLKM